MRRSVGMVWLGFCGLFGAQAAMGGPPAPRAQEEYCRQMRDPAEFMRTQVRDPRARLAFANDGGLANGGVCWWHSLFQRASLYLAVYRPELPRPDAATARRLILSLIRQNQVVEIPGYSDLFSFSRDWHAEIQKALDQWQGVDGFVKQEWIRNLSRKPWTSPDDLRNRMEQLRVETEKYHRLPWVMLKLEGITAHAWLVVSATRTQHGTLLEVIDSNAPGTVRTFSAEDGDRSIRIDFGPTVPYLGHEEFFPAAAAATRRYCAGV